MFNENLRLKVIFCLVPGSTGSDEPPPKPARYPLNEMSARPVNGASGPSTYLVAQNPEVLAQLMKEVPSTAPPIATYEAAASPFNTITVDKLPDLLEEEPEKAQNTDSDEYKKLDRGICDDDEDDLVDINKACSSSSIGENDEKGVGVMLQGVGAQCVKQTVCVVQQVASVKQVCQVVSANGSRQGSPCFSRKLSNVLDTSNSVSLECPNPVADKPTSPLLFNPDDGPETAGETSSSSTSTSEVRHLWFGLRAFFFFFPFVRLILYIFRLLPYRYCLMSWLPFY